MCIQVLIIDGLNLIRTYNKGVRPFPEELLTSEKIVNVLNRSNATQAYKKEVYFDGPKRCIYTEDNSTDILFSRYKKADSLIVNNVAGYLQNFSLYEVIVVTSDKSLAKHCEYYGAKIVHSNKFIKKWLDFDIKFYRS